MAIVYVSNPLKIVLRSIGLVALALCSSILFHIALSTLFLKKLLPERALGMLLSPAEFVGSKLGDTVVLPLIINYIAFAVLFGIVWWAVLKRVFAPRNPRSSA